MKFASVNHMRPFAAGIQLEQYRKWKMAYLIINVHRVENDVPHYRRISSWVILHYPFEVECLISVKKKLSIVQLRLAHVRYTMYV